MRTEAHRLLVGQAAAKRHSKTTAEQKFWAKVDKSGECWLWTGSKYRQGYGQVCVGPKFRKAHRVAYELTRGPIPTGLCVCHKCDVKLCVNPEHLFLGTYADNNADKALKGRAYRSTGELQPAAKLTDADVIAILNDPRPSTHLAPIYGVDHSLIGRIRRGKAWKHIPRAELMK